MILSTKKAVSSLVLEPCHLPARKCLASLILGEMYGLWVVGVGGSIFLIHIQSPNQIRHMLFYNLLYQIMHLEKSFKPVFTGNAKQSSALVFHLSDSCSLGAATFQFL